MSIRVGIVGISGFGGGEAMRLIASHPSFELIYAAGEGSAGSRLGDRFPGVPVRLAELVIEKWDPGTLPKLDVLFASLPTGTSAEALARVPKDVKIVDIGGDINSTLELAMECGDLKLLNRLLADETYAALLRDRKPDFERILKEAQEWAIKAEAHERVYGPKSLIDHDHWAIIERAKSLAAYQARKAWLELLASRKQGHPI